MEDVKCKSKVAFTPENWVPEVLKALSRRGPVSMCHFP